MRFSYHPWTSLVAAVALWLGLLPLSTMVQGAGYLIESAVVLAIVGGTGAALAALRLQRMLVLMSQLVAGGAYVVWRATSLAGAGITDPLGSMQALVAEGVVTIRTGAAPVEPTPGLMWLIVALTGLLILVVELLVNVLEQPAWAIAPVALVYGIASIAVIDELSFVFVLPVVVGYLALLLSATGLADEVTGKASRVGAYLLSRAQVAVAFGAVAVALALVLAPLVPLGQKQPWNNNGPDGPIQLSDPTVRLEQDLKRPEDTRVLTYRTSNDESVYMRTVALPELTTTGARLLPMRLSRIGLAGAHTFPGERVEIDVAMAGVPSEYLPNPFAAESIDAEGSWSFDPDTMSIVASGPDRLEQTIDLNYSVVSTLPSPSREDIEAAEAGGGVNAVTVAVPEGLAPVVADLTADVVSEAATAGQKALAIQEFLRSDAFSYSLEAPPSTGSDAISAFLLEERAGYCIHFAAGMITMARLEGIPARMAVGFAPGERLEDGSFEVTAHDAHAWPELFLDGLGWVPFEPTPAFDGPPEYTDPATQPSGAPSDSPSPSPSTPSTLPSALPSEQPLPTFQPSAPGGDGTVGWLGWLLAAIGLAALSVPATLRLGQRWWRLRRGQEARVAAGSAWAEVEALFRDFRRPWPDGSPGPVSEAADLPPNGAAALRELAHTVEVSRFSRDAADPGRLPAQVRAVRASLWADSSAMVRARAVLLPASLWRRLPAG